MPAALLALFAAAFAIGTSEFVIAGILPAVSTDLGISIPEAGNLVSLYALGVAVGGPLLATFAGRFSRQRLLLGYVGIFTIGYVACAVAPGYPLLLAARAGVSLIHGAYFGAALVTAAEVVEEKRRGFAISLILAGLTVANIVGVPIGTAIGNSFGWRMTFWSVAGTGLVSFALIAALVPYDPPRPGEGSSILAGLRALAREPVYSSLAIIIVQTIGQFALYTYIAPFLTDVTGISLDVVPWLLLMMGIGSTIGMLGGGRLADWRLMASLTVILAVQAAIYLVMIPFAHDPWIFGALILLWGCTTFAFASPAQARIISSTRDAPLLAASLIPSSFNIAIAFGAWLGGTLIAHGAPYDVLPWIGFATTLAAVAIAAASWLVDRRRRPAAAAGA